MNMYTGERWPLDRHSELVREAENRAALVPEPRATPPARWLAMRLRRVADRLDGRQGFEAQLRVIR